MKGALVTAVQIPASAATAQDNSSASLRLAVRSFIETLIRDHLGQLQNQQELRKLVLAEVKRCLRLPPGRPREDNITRAIELHRSGSSWPAIYRQCIPDYESLTATERRLAQQNLRNARRSRLNAARRRKLKKDSSAKTNQAHVVSPPQVKKASQKTSGKAGGLIGEPP